MAHSSTWRWEEGHQCSKQARAFWRMEVKQDNLPRVPSNTNLQQQPSTEGRDIPPVTATQEASATTMQGAALRLFSESSTSASP